MRPYGFLDCPTRFKFDDVNAPPRTGPGVLVCLPSNGYLPAPGGAVQGP